MILKYANFPYFLYIFIAFAFTATLFFALKNKSDKTKKITIFIFVTINTLQRIFTQFLYPQYEAGFSYICSAYTLCSLFIIIYPFIFISESKLLKDSIFFFGSTAGLFAILIPYAAIAEQREAFCAETIRYYICHILLFTTSLLPVILKIHKVNYKNAFKIPLVFFVAQAIVLLNDMLFISSGNLENWNADTLYEGLKFMNPGWSMRPNEGFTAVNDIIRTLSPKIFYYNSAGEEFTWPILWSAVPYYVAITLLTFSAGALMNLKEFKSDVINIKNKLTAKFKRK